MLFGISDMAAFAASHPLKNKPDTECYYTSGTTNILSRLIRHTVSENEYHSYPYRQLFYKLGMYNCIMEVDTSGTFVGSSYSWGTARDWARFGLLYLTLVRRFDSTRIPKNVVPSDTAQMQRDIIVTFISNESPLKTGFRSITDDS